MICESAHPEGGHFHKSFRSAIVDNAVREKQYYNDSSEYKHYQEVLLKNDSLILYSDQSVEYENTNQLIEIGFLDVNEDYRQYSQLTDKISTKPIFA
jgi:hypothetical protein